MEPGAAFWNPGGLTSAETAALLLVGLGGVALGSVALGSVALVEVAATFGVFVRFQITNFDGFLVFHIV